MKTLRRHLTYANAISTIALFVALGGASYAALEIPARSVGTPELKRGAVTSGKVRDGAVKIQDLDPELRQRIERPIRPPIGLAPPGPAGPTGPTGPPGPPAPIGPTGP